MCSSDLSTSDDGSRSTPSNLPKAATRRRTAVDYRFHTKEQQDFYETILLDKKPIVCDMRWVDWTYMKENEEHYPGVQDRFVACGVANFVGQKLTNWND